MAICFANGMSAQNTNVDVIKYLRQQAEQGNTEALLYLGTAYDTGTHGVSQSYGEAMKWFRKAAEKGDAQGQFYVGYYYEKGKGVNKDYAEAMKWYRKAEIQGYTGAMNRLGYCYENGNGVKQDYAEAVKWFRKAAEHGDDVALRNLERLKQLGYSGNPTIQSNGLLHKGTYISGTTQYNIKTGEQESRSPETYEIEIYNDSIIVDGNTYSFLRSEDGILRYMGRPVSSSVDTFTDYYLEVDANYKKIKLEESIWNKSGSILDVLFDLIEPFSSLKPYIEIYYYLYEK